jgi:hypothetical protein
MTSKRKAKGSSKEESTEARYLTPEKYRNGQVNGQYIPIRSVQGIRQ